MYITCRQGFCLGCPGCSLFVEDYYEERGRGEKGRLGHRLWNAPTERCVAQASTQCHQCALCSTPCPPPRPSSRYVERFSVN